MIELKPKLGLIVPLRRDPLEEIEKVKNLGFQTCQISCWDMSLYERDVAEKLLKLQRYGLDSPGRLFGTLRKAL